ncbi:replication-associated recombination protein A [Haloimpatiens lingqiaonensis]|uniref:replication-associated recombination protein A n=1 Tax=Haloimpatiens lingqiaonensis TaxID=1380675 RepID=UPI001FAA9674|nr:replication-associated recombination protein A [Haloimpatiens lingqiaonensis]
MKPLADSIRPNSIEEVVGQEHLLGKGKILNKMLSTGKITNSIFYGPPGVGKTTVANLMAKASNKSFYKLNATNASLKDIKDIVDELDSLMNLNGVILYLDEIQNFNKKQQQSLLEFMENGKITLIASTTENPFHYVYKAILSRSAVFEFKPIGHEHIEIALERALELAKKDFKNINIKADKKILSYIATLSDGDLRRAINILELCINTTDINDQGILNIDEEVVKNCCAAKILNYDGNGESHYDILSAFQKSIRGSHVDASLHYLARLIKVGDLISICRRLLVIAAEDIGLAYPNAITIVKSCTDAAMQLGFPEAKIPLAEAVILLATAPKSNSALVAIDRALEDLEKSYISEIPSNIRDGHYKGAESLGRMQNYKYPHDYPNSYIQQQYMPSSIEGNTYYEPGNNKLERNAKEYWDKIKGKI